MSDDTPGEGLGRRDLLKRGAMVGGALVWTVPAVQTLAGPAFANGSPATGKCTLFNCLSASPTNCQGVCFTAKTPACCAEAERINLLPASTPAEITTKGNAIIAFFITCGAELTPGGC